VFRDGWFYPGDIGAVTADNVLIVSGRQTAVLNVGGNKMGPEMIEQAAMAFPGVTQAGAYGVENSFGILEVRLAIVATQGLDEAGLHRHLQKHLPDIFVPRQMLRLANLPRNATGKLDRARLANMGRSAAPQ
jgi:acyl-coenzyme A synthetase/AMP-(fatty) acid ligase